MIDSAAGAQQRCATRSPSTSRSRRSTASRRRSSSFIARMQIIEKLQRSRPEIVHVFDELRARRCPTASISPAVTQTGPALQDRGRRPVLDARVLVHAQHRRLRVAEADPELEVVETKRGNTAGSELHAVRAPGHHPAEDVAASGAAGKATRRPACRRAEDEMNIRTTAQLDPKRSGSLAAAGAPRRRRLIFVVLSLLMRLLPRLEEKNPLRAGAGRGAGTLAARRVPHQARQGREPRTYKQQLEDIERRSAPCCASCRARPRCRTCWSTSRRPASPRASRRSCSSRSRAEPRLLRRAADQDPPHGQLSRVGRVRQRHRGAAAHRHAAQHRDQAGAGRLRTTSCSSTSRRQDLPLPRRRGESPRSRASAQEGKPRSARGSS
jgi:hypothetical protein